MDRLNATRISPQAISALAAAVGRPAGWPECALGYYLACAPLEPGHPGGLELLSPGHLCQALWLSARPRRCSSGCRYKCDLMAIVGCLLRVESPYHAWAQILHQYRCPHPYGESGALSTPRADIHPSVHSSPRASALAPTSRLAKAPSSTPTLRSILLPKLGPTASCTLPPWSSVRMDLALLPPRKKGAGLEKIMHIGQAILADHVEIGANSCIDRAVVGATYIGRRHQAG